MLDCSVFQFHLSIFQKAWEVYPLEDPACCHFWLYHHLSMCCWLGNWFPIARVEAAVSWWLLLFSASSRRDIKCNTALYFATYQISKLSPSFSIHRMQWPNFCFSVSLLWESLNQLDAGLARIQLWSPAASCMIHQTKKSLYLAAAAAS